MPDYDHAVTVNHNWLYKSVLLDALRNVVDLPLIMLFAFAAYGTISASRRFVISMPSSCFATSPTPWPYIADFTRPEGLQRCLFQPSRSVCITSAPVDTSRYLAQAAGVEPAYLGVKVPCLTIWLRLCMSPLGHIVERCAGSYGAGGERHK